MAQTRDHRLEALRGVIEGLGPGLAPGHAGNAGWRVSALQRSDRGHIPELDRSGPRRWRTTSARSVRRWSATGWTLFRWWKSWCRSKRRYGGWLDVAQALLPAASALMPTPAFDTASRPRTGVETSLDTTGTSACA